MKKLVTLFAVLGLVLALAPAAQAGLVITVFENTGTGNVDFSWNGIIGNSGTAAAPTANGAADSIIPLDGTLAVGDRSTNDLNDDAPNGFKKWTPSGVYAGTTSVFGSGAGTSDFLVTANIPFWVKSSDGGLFVGYTDQGNVSGPTGAVDLSSTVFTGSFSLPGTLADWDIFDTGPTALPCTVWTATTGTGSIVFQAPGTPGTLVYGK
jgi:hypothetical protein